MSLDMVSFEVFDEKADELLKGFGLFNYLFRFIIYNLLIIELVFVMIGFGDDWFGWWLVLVMIGLVDN